MKKLKKEKRTRIIAQSEEKYPQSEEIKFLRSVNPHGSRNPKKILLTKEFDSFYSSLT